MKILHTGDWHLGKKLNGICRLDEQRQVLDEIVTIAEREMVDVIAIAGDIFDTSVPSALAEQLFYETVVRLSKVGKVIVLAGNHDDSDRLSAASSLAAAFDVVLAGNQFLTVDKKGFSSGEGFVRIECGCEKLNLVVLPYPTFLELSNRFKNEEELNFVQMVAKRLDMLSVPLFKDDEFNVVLSHLFMLNKSENIDYELSDERELGGAQLLPLSIFPQKTDAVLLGHIHKPMTVCAKQSVFYSGSILPYSFDDTSKEKSVGIVSLEKDKDGKKRVEYKRIKLTSGKTLKKIVASGFNECERALKENLDSFVFLVYCGTEPLKLSELITLKKYASFCKIENTFLTEKKESVKALNSTKTTEELFIEFYKRKNGTSKEPSKELVQMFLDVVNEGNK